MGPKEGTEDILSEISVSDSDGASAAEHLIDEMDIGDELGLEHRWVMIEATEEYSKCFSKREGDLSCCTEMEHHVRMKDDHPVCIPHRSVPPQHREELQKYLKQ